jgi:hypothetical protein
MLSFYLFDRMHQNLKSFINKRIICSYLLHLFCTVCSFFFLLLFSKHRTRSFLHNSFLLEQLSKSNIYLGIIDILFLFPITRLYLNGLMTLTEPEVNDLQSPDDTRKVYLSLFVLIMCTVYFSISMSLFFFLFSRRSNRIKNE